MQGASRESLAGAEDRLAGLLGQSSVDGALVGSELYALTDLLDGQPALRTSLTDPARSGDDKAGLVRSLISGKVSVPLQEYVEGTVRSRWSQNRDLADAFEGLAAESLLAAAESSGRLETLEDDLFRFARLVAAEPALRAALTDRALPIDRKGALIHELLGGKASPEAETLITRVITRPRGRSLEAGLASIADLAAARRQRTVATVTAAVPMSAAQRSRLAASLAATLGHEVHLNVLVEPEVIGGLRVSIGDEVIDGTLATRLAEAQRRITH